MRIRAAKYPRGSVARVRRSFALFLVAALSFAAAGCGGSGNKPSAGGTTSTSGNICGKANLTLVNPGQLTVGTDNPAYPPWFGGEEESPGKVSDPRSRPGVEG